MLYTTHPPIDGYKHEGEKNWQTNGMRNARMFIIMYLKFDVFSSRVVFFQSIWSPMM